MPTPYVTWDEVANDVQGEDRLKEILLPRIEDADSHPFFDQKLAAAMRYADVAMENGGLETPPPEPYDPLFKRAVSGILVGFLTEGSSKREGFEQGLWESGVAYFAKVEEGTASVLGAEDESPAASSLLLGFSADRSNVFDYDDPESEISGVFAPLGHRSSRFGWRR